MTTLVLSPHLDDAVLSLPAWMRSRVEVGERVVVVTVFSDGDERHVARRAEDCAALALLGVEPIHLGLLDAPLRRRTSETFRDLILAPLHADDDDARHVATIVTKEIARLVPDVTLFPLGVGEHIDHRIVHAAHAHVTSRVGFYEDRPYALVCDAVRARFAKVDLKLQRECFTFEPEFREIAARAVRAYGSQSPTFTSDVVRALSTDAHGYEERVFWREE